MGSNPLKYRIIGVDTRMYGPQFAIEKEVSFLFFWRRWERTHLCDTLEQAESVVQYRLSFDFEKVYEKVLDK